MFKKVLVVAVIAAVAVVAVRQTRLGGIVRQEVTDLREWAESQVPPETEIKRMRTEIKALEQDRLKLTHILATENVDVKNLRTKTAEDRAGLEKEAALLVARGQAIKAATEKVSYGNEVLPVSVATQRLAADRVRYDVYKKSVEGMETHLAARERNREALEKQLNTLNRQQQDLELAVNGLETELNILKVQQMESKHQTDDTRLAGIKESIRAMQRKIDIQKEKLRLTPSVYEAPNATPTSGKSVDEILNGLEGPKAEPKKVPNSD